MLPDVQGQDGDAAHVRALLQRVVLRARRASPSAPCHAGARRAALVQPSPGMHTCKQRTAAWLNRRCRDKWHGPVVAHAQAPEPGAARAWLGVLSVTSALFRLGDTISHAKPDPKRVTPVSVKLALNAVKLPQVASMALDRALSVDGALALALPVGGAMHLK